jgi:2-methylaconitate cis-trans-isomerase PrpF
LSALLNAFSGFWSDLTCTPSVCTPAAPIAFDLIDKAERQLLAQHPTKKAISIVSRASGFIARVAPNAGIMTISLKNIEAISNPKR